MTAAAPEPVTYIVPPTSNVSPVGADKIPPGFNPPQQARSRAALQRIVIAAEQLLATMSSDELTMAAVADHAGVSIGSIYSRFAGKDQLLNAVKDRLLTRVEEGLAQALDAADDNLASTVETFTRALADGFSAGAHVLPSVLGGDRNKELAERGARALETIQRLFLGAAMRHIDEVRRPDPMTALVLTARTITGSGIHRTTSAHIWPDGISWGQWAGEVSTMATAYLTTPDPSR
ncbi:TetR/AcrR family transcriptional regulator [Nocardia alni]|uniref:TetR/AcrR family transcriptional regulator n=1 Tax=Nocardia alni TaxID=2815723 RepID=UPI001C244BC9|nr:TetR/AcrR family transcriptional regulator [Nocardia alni]